MTLELSFEPRHYGLLNRQTCIFRRVMRSITISHPCNLPFSGLISVYLVEVYRFEQI
jgi:hypothetical protein